MHAARPTKPVIVRESDVIMGRYVMLTCLSNSTSTPDYYKFESLTYTWYINNDTETGFNGNKYRIDVEKNPKTSSIACKSRQARLDSEKSEPVQLHLQCE